MNYTGQNESRILPSDGLFYSLVLTGKQQQTSPISSQVTASKFSPMVIKGSGRVVISQKGPAEKEDSTQKS